MTQWLPVVLAAAAAAVWVAPARDGSLRLRALAAPSRPLRIGPASWLLLLGGAGALMAGPAVALLGGAAAVAVRRSVMSRRTTRHADQERARALDALSLLAADLRAGRAPADALLGAADIAIGQSRGSLAMSAAVARAGGDVAASLRADSSVVAPTLHALAACWQVCSDAGSGLAGAVERLVEGLRAGEAQRRAVAAELAGPHATAKLLAVLPLGGIGLAGALGADPLQLLLHTPLGLCCLLGGLGLDALGVLWTRRLLRGALP